ncbi:aminopeptidase [Cladophialophora yegresii CBS 114405]|uniref:Peptide hydrolase n=1 Tax=Cladophialophora yegresii CBS 114405 TaxID=1182544 RepID=W9W7E5_9EURO|nr:aminopeptidase [Cladophialophora yegresii CBS 114405]EXJ60451.1 aminopeptidase [Cladophialophora yegresii CBS 114405]
MRSSTLPVLAALAASCAATETELPPVTSEALQALISLDGLTSGAQQLQVIADAAGGNRVFGSKGHNDTVYFLYDTLLATGYYDVYLQDFVELFSGGTSSLTVNGEAMEADLFTYDSSGSASADLVAVSNLGCELADYPPESANAVVLISRGECPFAQKASNAAAAGALGALIYNNVPGAISGGTLSEPGDYAPSLSISQEDGLALLAQVEAGTPVAVELEVNAILENRTTYNVIAETKGGDHDNVIALGAHTDSVEAGPGINDNGSGTIGILNVALALTRFTITNAVRFGFWSAEEFGLKGSTYYVSTLNQTAGETAKVRAYLNFDMIASPNYAYMIYDGDGSSFNLTGPPGSAEIEADFEAFFTSAGQNFTATAFDGRSDYGPFLENNIPAGGLFTGAEDPKTPEEVAMFGGTADVAYDANYHQPGDTIDNIAWDAFLLNTKAIANSIALYATDLSKIPPVSATALPKRARSVDVRGAVRSTPRQKRASGIKSHACTRRGHVLNI